MLDLRIRGASSQENRRCLKFFFNHHSCHARLKPWFVRYHVFIYFYDIYFTVDLFMRFRKVVGHLPWKTLTATLCVFHRTW